MDVSTPVAHKQTENVATKGDAMGSEEPMLFLSDQDLEALNIQPSEVADAIEVALIAKADGRLHTSPKTAILPGDGRYAMSTLAVGEDGFIVVKQVTVCPDNPAIGLPAINGAIMVLDGQTGVLRALLEANWITAVRTAALSAVAARRLADPCAETVIFVGAGVQAHAHLAAFSEMFPLKGICVLGRGQSNIEKLCQQARELGLDAEASTSAKDALQKADLVVTSVTLDYSIKSFLDARWLKTNAFAAITDACIPWVPDSMSAFKTVIVDDREQELESEKPMLPYEHISADLTELVTHGANRGKFEQPAAFAFRGISLGDYAAATLAVRRAMNIDV
jgi:ornithine cyclodeaminase/alanine dehydrogenase-like protein (mu-crystallin family)